MSQYIMWKPNCDVATVQNNKLLVNQKKNTDMGEKNRTAQYTKTKILTSQDQETLQITGITSTHEQYVVRRMRRMMRKSCF